MKPSIFSPTRHDRLSSCLAVRTLLSFVPLLGALLFVPACGDEADGGLDDDYRGIVYFEENGRSYSSSLQVKVFPSGNTRGSIERGAATCGFDGSYRLEGATLTLNVEKSRGKVCGWNAELSGMLSEDGTRYEGQFTEVGTEGLSGGFLLIRREEETR